MAHLEAACLNHGLTSSSIPEVLAGKGAKSEYLKPAILLLKELLPHGNSGLGPQHEPVNIGESHPFLEESGWGKKTVSDFICTLRGLHSWALPLRSQATRLCRTHQTTPPNGSKEPSRSCQPCLPHSFWHFIKPKPGPPEGSQLSELSVTRPLAPHPTVLAFVLHLGGKGIAGTNSGQVRGPQDPL